MFLIGILGDSLVFSFKTSSIFSKNEITCSIETDLKDVEFAYYIRINGGEKNVLYYPQPATTIFPCKDVIVDYYEVTFFIREPSGEIHSKIEERKTSWSLPEAALLAVSLLTPKDSLILEFGSGYGSHLIGKKNHLTSIEHDEKFVSRFSNVNYIHAPIKLLDIVNGDRKLQWYDPEIVKQSIPENYEMVILDGPPSQYGREAILNYLSFFKKNAFWIIDDVLRPEEQNIANHIAINFSLIQYRFWNFSILAPEPISSSDLLLIHQQSEEDYRTASPTYLDNYFSNPLSIE